MARPNNRVHTFTRWPSDPWERKDLAETDMDFVAAILRCGCGEDSLDTLGRIFLEGSRQAALAEIELGI